MIWHQLHKFCLLTQFVLRTNERIEATHLRKKLHVQRTRFHRLHKALTQTAHMACNEGNFALFDHGFFLQKTGLQFAALRVVFGTEKFAEARQIGERAAVLREKLLRAVM